MSKRRITSDQPQRLSSENNIIVQQKLISNYKKLTKEQTELISFLKKENKKLKEENLFLINHITYGNRDKSIAKCPSKDSIAVSAGANFLNYYNDVYNPFGKSSSISKNLYVNNALYPSYGANAKKVQKERIDSFEKHSESCELNSQNEFFERYGHLSRGYRTKERPKSSTVRAYCLRRRNQIKKNTAA